MAYKSGVNPGWTTESTHVGRIPSVEKILMEGRNISRRAEQKSVQMIANLVRNLTRGGHLVFGACGARFLTDTACLMLLSHRQFLDCAMTHESVSSTVPSLVLVLCRKVLNQSSSIWIPEDGERA